MNKWKATWDKTKWVGWKQEYPDSTIAPFWWVWHEGDPNAYFTLWPEGRQIPGKPTHDWYQPAFPPDPPTFS
jgi:hypothetical protein